MLTVVGNMYCGIIRAARGSSARVTRDHSHGAVRECVQKCRRRYPAKPVWGNVFCVPCRFLFLVTCHLLTLHNSSVTWLWREVPLRRWGKLRFRRLRGLSQDHVVDGQQSPDSGTGAGGALRVPQENLTLRLHVGGRQSSVLRGVK